MIHDITAGHFDPAGIADHSAIATKPIKMRIVLALLVELGDEDADGVPTLDGWKVRFEDGCVILPWLGGRTNHVSEEFAIRLQRMTGCTLADREHGQLIGAGELTGLNEQYASQSGR